MKKRLWSLSLILFILICCTINSCRKDDSGPKIYTAISAGFFSSFAIETNGNLWAWGDNSSGE